MLPIQRDAHSGDAAAPQPGDTAIPVLDYRRNHLGKASPIVLHIGPRTPSILVRKGYRQVRHSRCKDLLVHNPERFVVRKVERFAAAGCTRTPGRHSCTMTTPAGDHAGRGACVT